MQVTIALVKKTAKLENEHIYGEFTVDGGFADAGVGMPYRPSCALPSQWRVLLPILADQHGKDVKEFLTDLILDHLAEDPIAQQLIETYQAAMDAASQ